MEVKQKFEIVITLFAEDESHFPFISRFSLKHNGTNIRFISYIFQISSNSVKIPKLRNAHRAMTIKSSIDVVDCSFF